MTGHDHTDALTEALRQPALPAERAGEASAVASMAGALPTARAAGRGRPRKGVAILAVTVASLGVGGLAAAGPGTLQRGIDFISGNGPAIPAAATERSNPPASDVVPGGSSAAQPATPGTSPATPASPTTPAGETMAGGPPGTRESSDAGGVGDEGGADALDPVEDGSEPEHCVDDGHGQTVADAAGSPNDPTDSPGQQVSETARPDCGNAAAAGENGGERANTGGANPGQPADPGGAGQPANPNTGQPADPSGNDGHDATPPAPDAPGRPEQPGSSDQPSSSDQPDQPGQPGQPDQPDQPDQAGAAGDHPATPNPGQPAEPGEGGQPATPNPGAPAEPNPDQPGETGRSAGTDSGAGD